MPEIISLLLYKSVMKILDVTFKVVNRVGKMEVPMARMLI